jgi:hypothetical protein
VFAVRLATALTRSGCSLGPRVLELSHGPYNEAIRNVDEEEFLRNLVHIRYNAPRIHLNVSSITAQYKLAGGAPTIRPAH